MFHKDLQEICHELIFNPAQLDKLQYSVRNRKDLLSNKFLSVNIHWPFSNQSLRHEITRAQAHGPEKELPQNHHFYGFPTATTSVSNSTSGRGSSLVILPRFYFHLFGVIVYHTRGIINSQANLVLSFTRLGSSQPDLIFSELTGNIWDHFAHVQSFPCSVVSSESQEKKKRHSYGTLKQISRSRDPGLCNKTQYFTLIF